MTTLDLDRIDDLFPDVATQTPLFSQPPLIASCLVCGRGGRADLSRPLICDRCGADLPAARALVDYLLVNAEKDHEAAYDAWAAALDGADAKTRQHYDLYDDLRVAGDPRSADAELQAAAGNVKPVFHLIRLRLRYQEKEAAWQAAREWAIQCDEVLR